MGVSKSEFFTARFYEWELRGRGWHVCQFPVELEPDFHPFFGHFAPEPQILDDSRKPTLVSAIIDLFSSRRKIQPRDNSDLVNIPPVMGHPFEGDIDIIVYSVVLPKGDKLEVEDMEQLFLMLSYTAQPVSFEIIGTHEAITIQLVCREIDAAHVYEQAKAYFPTAILTRNEKGKDVLADDCLTCVADLGLRDEFMLPLKMASEVDQDPYIGLFATLEHIQKGEQGVIQILFKGAVNPWAESIMRAVTDSKGGSFFADAPEMVKLAQEKISAPLFSVSIRIAGQAQSGERATNIAEQVAHALMRLTRSKANGLHPLKNGDYDVDNMIADMFLRQTQRMGMLLNSRELATLAHFPTPEIASAKVKRETKKTQAAPESTEGHKFVLGMNVHHGMEKLVSVPTSLRLRHTHLIGATGTGKSTLLLSMIAQDMKLGNGLAILDPHGDLIESILPHVPPERIKDVIVIDPADADFPVGFNILSAHSEIEKDILSSDLVAAFKRLSTSWGDQMNSVFANAILAFLESTDDGTLLDLRRFLIEKPFRDNYLKTVSDAHIVYYWQHEYPLLKSSSLGSILTRLDTFLRPKLIRNMVAQKKGLDFESILDTKKILLIKLSQGLIGAENSFLLGTFFVSKIYQAAMARQAKSKENRTPYYLYIDEFHHYATPSISHLLSGARKYFLGLIVAHQDMQQLQKYDTELANSVVVNAGTRICFRLGDVDARRFASGFSHFEAEDLENLHTGAAIARIEQPSLDFNLTTLPLSEVDMETAQSISHAVIASSRRLYGTPREEVEQSLEQFGKVVVEEVQKPTTKEKIQEVAPPQEEPQMPFVPVVLPNTAKPVQKTETQHRYLQMLIKKMAESWGYKAMIEETTPDGKGRVDVSLERSGKKIACEVSVTTDDTWEIHNVEKCLAAGYDMVIVCSNDAKNLARIREKVEGKLSTEQQAKVLTLSPEEAVQFFDRQIIDENSTEKIVKGYRVKVEYSTSTAGEIAKKQDYIAKAVTSSIKKNKK